MRVLLQVAAALALTGALVAPFGAQNVPNLSGTWVLVLDKSNFGAMPAPTSRTDVIDHKEPALTIKRTQSTPNGEITSNLVYGIDGKAYKNLAGGNEVTGVLRWDGQTLVIESDLSTPDGVAKIVDRFSLSADQKTPTQERTISMQGQEVAQTIVLAKQ